MLTHNFNPNQITIGNDIVNINLERCKFKHNDQKFVDRILNLNEKLHLSKCLNKSTNLWMMWAAKEAAFKALQKTNLNLIFSPRKFEVYFDFKELDSLLAKNFCTTSLNPQGKVQSNNFSTTSLLPQEQAHANNVFTKNLNLQGKVQYQDKWLYATWQINQIFIHCVCIYTNQYDQDPTALYNYHIFTIDSSSYAIESQQTKLQAIQYLLDHGFKHKLEIVRPNKLINRHIIKSPPILLLNNQPTAYDISLSHDHGFGALAYTLRII